MGYFAGKPYQRRPRAILTPKRDSSLGRGLVVAFAHQNGFQLWTSQGVVFPTLFSGNNSLRTGLIHSADGAHIRYDVPNILNSGLTNCTFAASWKISATEGARAGGFNLYITGNEGGRLGLQNYTNSFYFNCDDDSSLKNIITPSGASTSNVNHDVACTYNGNRATASQRFSGFANGVKYTDSDVFRSSLATTYDRLYINAYAFSDIVYDDGEKQFNYGYIWDRTLSDEEIASVRANPYQMFERRIWVPVGGEAPAGIDVDVPLATYAIASNIPAVYTGSSVDTPLATYAISANIPAVEISATIGVPTAPYAIASSIPTILTGASVAAPLATYAIGANVPTIPTGVAVDAPLATYSISASVPSIGGGVSLDIPLATYAISSNVPGVSTGVLVDSPLATYAISANIPAIPTGASIDAPVATYAIAVNAPTIQRGQIDVPLAIYTISSFDPTLGGALGGVSAAALRRRLRIMQAET